MTDAADTETRDGEQGRYRTYESDDGRFVVFDAHNGDAYVRSDVTTELRR